MHLPFADFDAIAPGWLVLAGLLIVVTVATRLPIIGGVMRAIVTLAIVGVLVLVLAERERFDPYIGRIAGFLNLDHQEVSGREMRVRMSPDGHFWVRARINGVERRLLIDSGATVTALSAETARAANIRLQPGLFPILLNTANGTIRADGGTIAELKLGNIVARRLAVVVSPSFDEIDVLGMNFLSRLESWRVEGRTLILVPHHPQWNRADTRS
jgi:aspartyl protease family protein